MKQAGNLDQYWEHRESGISESIKHLLEFREAAKKRGVVRCSILTAPPFHSLTGANSTMHWWGYDQSWIEIYLEFLKVNRDDIPDLAFDHGKAIFFRDIKQILKQKDGRFFTYDTFLKYHNNDAVNIPLFSPFGYKGFCSVSFGHTIENIEDDRIVEIANIGRISHDNFVRDLHLELMPKRSLSKREIDIIEEMAKGSSNKVLARRLLISPNSVDTYLRRIFTKLGVKNRPQAVVRALTLGLFRL